VSNSVNS